jgi:UDP-N-acetylglucosamine--N-acetylmuramyl-(pentapeptide) pyrophosphoryl-undecaprenol N-acetylglucosamine transferase
MSREIRVLIAAGGTGGHVYPGIAMAEAFLQRFPSCEVRFVGTERGLENRLVAEAGYPLEHVRASRVKNAGLFARLAAVIRLPLGIWDARRILKKFKTDIVVSVGGYSAAPTVIAAWLSRIPSVAIEPNAVPGLTNRVLGRLSGRILLGFEQAASWFAKSKTCVTGVPLRSAAVDALLGAAQAVKDPNKTARILVFGGSQGARFLNERMPETLRGLEIEVLHQTGEAGEALTRQRYQDAGVNADVRPYIIDMAGAYAQADLAVTRAGASTVAELATAGLPSLLIPFPFAADDHQAANAAALEQAGAAKMVRQEDWNDDEMRDWIAGLLASRQKVDEMAQAARSLGHQDAANLAVDACIKLLEQRGIRLLGLVV